MTNWQKYIDSLEYLEPTKDGRVYRKARRWNNNGGWQYQERRECRYNIEGSGYVQTHIRINGKNYEPKVHILVALTYLGFPEKPDMQVNHKDGNKLNNHVSNLEWVTKSGNMKHAFLIGLNKVSNEQKQNLSQRMKENNPMKDKAVVEKAMKTRKERHPKSLLRQKVAQIITRTGEIVKIWDSITEAINAGYNNIPAVLSGVQHTCGGYYWKKVED